jgi:tripartite-type tricarboxylate transporter receptor subunit TctC
MRQPDYRISAFSALVKDNKKMRGQGGTMEKNLWGIGLGVLILLLLNIHSLGAKEPDYPTKPVTFIISFGAGGTADLSGRAFAEAAGKYLGQPFIPVNKPGAGGVLAATAVMNAKPDGYTLGTILTSAAFVAPFSGEAPYKDLENFAMMANYGNNVYPMMVRSDAPWKNWKEFIEWAKKNPRAGKIAITGARAVASQGLVLWQVEKRERVEFTYITFKSSSEILSATLGGHVSLYGSTVDPATVPYLKEGKLRVLTYLGTEKIPGYEGIPSLQELYGFSIPNLMAVYGPKGIPEYALKKLDGSFAKAVKDPDFVSAMNRMYTPIVYMDRVQLNRYVEETLPRAGEIMRALKAEEAKEKK